MQKNLRDIILDWGRGHDLLDKLGVPNDAPLAERIRRMLVLVIPGKLKGPKQSGIVQTNRQSQKGEPAPKRKAKRKRR